MAQPAAAEFDVMSKLTDLIQHTIDALEATGSTVDKPLPGGMHIHLRKDGSSYVLTIWRERVPPSAREWNTVIAHWPYLLGPINWSKAGVTTSGKYIKQARIPVQPT